METNVFYAQHESNKKCQSLLSITEKYSYILPYPEGPVMAVDSEAP